MNKSDLLILIIIAVFTFNGCDSKRPEPLRIGTNVWPGYEPLYLARELSYFQKDQVRLIEYTSASQVIRAFRNNSIDGAAVTLDEALLLTQYNPDLKIILVMDISHGGDVLLAKPEYTDMAALSGKRIGVETSAMGAYMLSRALQSAQIDTKDINIVSLPVDEHENAYLNNQVDAVVTFEPVRSKLLQQGAVNLFDSSQIPGEIVDVLIVRTGYLNKHKDNVEHLVQGWFKALTYLETYPDAAYPLLAPRLQLETEQVKQSYVGLQLPDLAQNQKLLSEGESSINNTIQRLAQVLMRLKLVQGDISTSGLLENSFLYGTSKTE